VVRSEEHPDIVSFKERMETSEAKETYKQRGRLMEFVNVWIKGKMKFRRFHVRGKFKVGMEMTWVAIAYNLGQWMRSVWRPT
jgi:hypothetical protein